MPLADQTSARLQAEAGDGQSSARIGLYIFILHHLFDCIRGAGLFTRLARSQGLKVGVNSAPVGRWMITSSLIWNWSRVTRVYMFIPPSSESSV